MNNAIYVAGALRTDCVYNEELLARFTNPVALSLFRRELGHAISHGTTMDHFKKYFIYNRNLPLFVRTQPEPEPPEVLERLRDCVRLLHAAIGLYTESVEFIETLYKYVFNGDPMDTINLIEEGGDIFWYMAIFADEISCTFEDMEDRNQRKLAARYPAKFTERLALNRNLGAERQELEIAAAPVDLTVEAEPVAVRGRFGGTAVVGEDIENVPVDNDAVTLAKLSDILQRHRGERGHREGIADTLFRIIRERDQYWDPNRIFPQFIGRDVLPETVQSLMGILERQWQATDADCLQTAERIIAKCDSLGQAVAVIQRPQFCHMDLAPEGLQGIIDILQQHCGERGDNEGAVETLQRIVRERKELEEFKEFIQDQDIPGEDA